MKSPTARTFLLAGLLFAGAASGLAQAAAPAPAPKPDAQPESKAKSAPPPESKSAPEAAKPAAPAVDAPAGVQQMTKTFDLESKSLLAQRRVLLDRLNQAKTEEEKQRILAEIREQQQQRIAQQRELARQIREQMQNRRGVEAASAARP